jgi:hypothetical protein
MGRFWLACITQIQHAVHCMGDIDQHMLVTLSAISHGHLSELSYQNESIVVMHQLCIIQANRSTGRRRLG